MAVNAGAGHAALREGDERAVDAVRSWLESGAWTEELYFALPEANHIIELSGGKLIIPDMPTRAHQRVVLRLGRELSGWNERRPAGEVGEVVVAAYPVRLAEGIIREPDVMYYAAEHLDRLEEQRGGPPDLAVEVLSPSTRVTDLRDKAAEYARAGVREYWIVDPDERWVEVQELHRDTYRRVGRYGAGDTVVSGLLPGFAVAVETLFAG